MQDKLTKHCSGCGQTKPITEFAKCSRTKDGRFYRCSTCRAKERKMYADRYKANAGTITQRKCAQCEIVKPASDFRAVGLTKSGLDSYCIACRKERHQDAYWSNPDKYRERIKNFLRRNPLTWDQLHKRRCRNYKIPCVLTEEVWREILALHNNGCARCGSQDRIETDHIIPVRWGGVDEPWNIQPLCWAHNASKNCLVLVDYRSRECRERFPCAVEDIWCFQLPTKRIRKRPAPGLKRNRKKKLAA